MQLVKVLAVCLLFAVVGFFAGGFFARFVLIRDNTGFEGASTAALSAFAGAAIGVVLAILVLRR